MKRNLFSIFFILFIFTLNTLGCVSKPAPEPKEEKTFNPLSVGTGAKKEEKTESKVEIEPTLYVNQVGYLTSEEKYFITNTPLTSFEIIDSETDEGVFTGEITLNIEDDRSSGMTTYIGYFTQFNSPGNYYIKSDNDLKSYPFTIDENIFDDIAKKSMQSFYFQRCGVPLLEEHAGEFSRETCHIDDAPYHLETGLEGSKDVSGGWHDAGDYGKYVTPAAITVGPMLIAYEMWPEKFNYDDNGIPESGNGISDFLDEVKFELDWIYKMQHRDNSSELNGAVHYMVNNTTYVWTMPQDDDKIRYLYGFSSVATADFAAIMAQAYRTYKIIPEFKEDAQRYLDAAILAWGFLEKNPELYPTQGYKRPDDTVTGGYVESADGDDIDDRTWAAVELYLSTGDQKYHEYALAQRAFKNPRSFTKIPDWKNTTAMAQWQYLLADSKVVKEVIQNGLKKALIKKADGFVRDSQKDGFRDSLTSYKWGSNGHVMLHANYLLTAYQLTGEKKYYNTALSQLNYVLGLNPVNTSYVTKTGTVSPQWIHHASILNDNSDDIYPGLVAGGANGEIGSDFVMTEKFSRSTPDALCYIDHFSSWGSNENCILYNGPLVGVAAFFSGIK